ncbi:uncharacterized protein LOC142775880 [Rhipicephalus microplus]|uniref:uncharacterized protein LOC142775880 n=1 Tax=Rhipicephalus microplus TaxID=6941 RepID=UPI003F6AC88C
MLSVNNLVRPPKRASVDGDGPQLLFKLQDLFNKEAAPVNHVDSLAILLDDVLLEPTESEEEALADLSPKECILDYLAGYVAQKFSEMCCTDCVESLKGLQQSPSDLILVKSRGYLQVPSTKLLNLLQIAEEHVEEFTVKQTACAGVYMGIVEQVLLDNRTASAAVGCPTHFVGTTAEVLHFFLRCRLHFFTRTREK